jgi:hypothetical protein
MKDRMCVTMYVVWDVHFAPLSLWAREDGIAGSCLGYARGGNRGRLGASGEGRFVVYCTYAKDDDEPY